MGRLTAKDKTNVLGIIKYVWKATHRIENENRRSEPERERESEKDKTELS